MVLVPIVDVFYVCVVFSWCCAVGVLIAREMLAFDGEVVAVAIHPSHLRSSLELGATSWESTLSPLMLSCGVDKAYSSDEVVRVEVVLWRLWVEIVEIERALRVRCLESRPVYLYPCHWLKHHLLALGVVLMCLL